jgi:hypothetical protein
LFLCLALVPFLLLVIQFLCPYVNTSICGSVSNMDGVMTVTRNSVKNQESFDND